MRCGAVRCGAAGDQSSREVSRVWQDTIPQAFTKRGTIVALGGEGMVAILLRQERQCMGLASHGYTKPYIYRPGLRVVVVSARKRVMRFSWCVPSMEIQ
jgi:hypothetical protein